MGHDTTNPGDPRATPMTILVVDDDGLSCALLNEHLSAAGHHVLTAVDAFEAMAVLAHAPVDLVIADCVMPGMSGLELCTWLRAHKPACQGFLHFVMLTQYDDLDRLQAAFEVGVDDFLAKPLQDGELLARLRAWGRFVRLQRDLDARRAEAVRLNGELAAANIELAGANARLAELATVDELTGLPNRRAAGRAIEACMADARAKGVPLACALADIDLFKRWNDTHGHVVGDRVLRHVAGAMADCMGPEDPVFRIGGDEFLVLFPGRTLAEADAVADGCRRAVEARPFAHAGTASPVTISVGLAELTAGTKDAEDLLHTVDVALYQAKRDGRNRSRSAA